MKLDFDIETKTPKLDFDMKDTTVINAGGGISESRVRQIVQEETEGLATEEYADNASAQAVTRGVTAHNVSQDTHKDIRNLISELSNRLNALADSDDTTLDQLSEIVAYIKANKALIESVTTSKVNVSDIVNDLETNVANKPLSASQGVALKALISALEQSVSGLAENAVNDIGSQVVEETNELTIELKDKNGKVIATTKVTLPTQEIPEVDLSGYVKNTDYAKNDGTHGVVCSNAWSPINIDVDGLLMARIATTANIDEKYIHRLLRCSDIDHAVKVGVTTNTETLTDDEKASACEWLGALQKPSGHPTGMALLQVTYNVLTNTVTYSYATVGLDSGNVATYQSNATDMSMMYGNGTTLYVDTPKGAKQAANKEYVDNLVGDINSLLERANEALDEILGV